MDMTENHELSCRAAEVPQLMYLGIYLYMLEMTEEQEFSSSDSLCHITTLHIYLDISIYVRNGK